MKFINSNYYDVIGQNGVGNCRQMNELFVSMLKYKNIIEKFYLVRKPEGVEGVDLRHIDAIIPMNGKKYMFNIKGDIENLRAGIRPSHFGFIDSKSRKVEEIKLYLQNNGICKEKIDELMKRIEEIDSDTILSELPIYEQKLGINDEIRVFLRNKLPKIKHIEQIEEKIGILEEIPIKPTAYNEQICIEYLDERVENVNHYTNLGLPFDFKIQGYRYFEDIIKYELIPRLVEYNSKLRLDWVKYNNVSLEENFNKNLEIDIDIIIDFITRISSQIDEKLLHEYIRKIIFQVYKERYKDLDINFKVWAQNHIKLFRMASIQELMEYNKNIPLKTIIAIRKRKPSEEDEKYIFYEFSESGVRKKSYAEFVEEMKCKEMRTCSKFLLDRKKSTEELGL